MGIFGSIRNIVGNSQNENSLWNQPQSIDEVQEILQRTRKPQVIYKHSYSCAVSLFAKSSLDNELESILNDADIHLIDVVAQRPLSRAVAEKTGIRHESPQIIVMHHSKPFWHATHGSVRFNSLRETLDELKDSPG